MENEEEYGYVYEKIITLNTYDFGMLNECMGILFRFIEDKCKNDEETLQFFQMILTNSDKSPLSKDLKIKWCVTKDGN